MAQQPSMGMRDQSLSVYGLLMHGHGTWQHGAWGMAARGLGHGRMGMGHGAWGVLGSNGQQRWVRLAGTLTSRGEVAPPSACVAVLFDLDGQRVAVYGAGSQQVGGPVERNVDLSQ